MTRMTLPARALSRALALLLLLAITTGWAQSAPAPGRTAAGLASNALGDSPAAAAGLGTNAVQPATPDDRSAVEAGSSLGFTWIDDAYDAPKPPIRAAAAVEVAPVAAPIDVNPAAKPVAKAPVYSGRNHFWIPSLGISDPVLPYACSRTRSPDNYMYRWGCAGTNNVYILGHAYSVMKPLHDAYVRGTLKVGMVAMYAGNNGVVKKYRVTTWRVVAPTEAAWAIASQPVESMTLQTCVGKQSQWRLLVRLVRFA